VFMRANMATTTTTLSFLQAEVMAESAEEVPDHRWGIPR
jgi:hypothetical protein